MPTGASQANVMSGKRNPAWLRCLFTIGLRRCIATRGGLEMIKENPNRVLASTLALDRSALAREDSKWKTWPRSQAPRLLPTRAAGTSWRM